MTLRPGTPASSRAMQTSCYVLHDQVTALGLQLEAKITLLVFGKVSVVNGDAKSFVRVTQKVLGLWSCPDENERGS